MRELLNRLCRNQFEFVIIGGFSAVLHGATYVTRDLDLCTPLHLANAEKLVRALQGLHPYHRLSTHRLPLEMNPVCLTRYRNLYLHTNLGMLDLLTEVAGLGPYSAVLDASFPLSLWELECRTLTLDGLIASKQALGQPKDLALLRQLLAIRDVQP